MGAKTVYYDIRKSKTNQQHTVFWINSGSGYLGSKPSLPADLLITT